MVAISRIEIWEDGCKVLAKVVRFDKTEEVIIWNSSRERNNILRQIDGYTFIKDSRLGR